jgi:hypothetical protein
MFAFNKTHVGGDDYIEAQAEFLAYRRKDDGFENAELWDPRVTKDPERHEIESMRCE